MLGRTRRGIRVFADVSVIAGFLMMGFAFWFLLNNVSNYFVEPSEFSELTVLIPGVTLTSSASIAYFLLSIPIVLVIHEGAHGIVATLEKIKIKTANELVKNRLAACVNISKIYSIYSWKGKVENTSEFLAIFKTTQKNKNSLKKAIKKMHPYEVPEIAEIDIRSINQPYLKWLIESTN